MGEKIIGQSEQLRTESDSRAAEGTGGKSASAASAGRTGAGGAGGTGTTAGGEKGKPRAENLELHKVTEKPKDAPVIVPTMTDEEKKKIRNRERQKAYRERKKAEKASANAAPDIANADQLVQLVVTLSSVVASREGMGHWQFTEAEARQIVTPLSNIIKSSTNIEDLGKYADHIALVIACVTIILPRAIISVQLAAAKKKAQKEVIKNDQRTEISKGSNGNNRQPAVEKSNVKTDTFDIRATIPAVAY